MCIQACNSCGHAWMVTPCSAYRKDCPRCGIVFEGMQNDEKVRVLCSLCGVDFVVPFEPLAVVLATYSNVRITCPNCRGSLKVEVPFLSPEEFDESVAAARRRRA